MGLKKEGGLYKLDKDIVVTVRIKSKMMRVSLEETSLFHHVPFLIPEFLPGYLFVKIPRKKQKKKDS